MDLTTKRRSRPVTGKVREAIILRSCELVVSGVDDPDTGSLGRAFQLVCLNVFREADGRPIRQFAVSDKLAALTPASIGALNLCGADADNWGLFSKNCLIESAIRVLEDRIAGSEWTSFRSEWISRVLNPLLERACLDLQLDWIACAGMLPSPNPADPPSAAATQWQLIWHKRNPSQRARSDARSRRRTALAAIDRTPSTPPPSTSPPSEPAKPTEPAASIAVTADVSVEVPAPPIEPATPPPPVAGAVVPAAEASAVANATSAADSPPAVTDSPPPANADRPADLVAAEPSSVLDSTDARGDRVSSASVQPSSPLAGPTPDPTREDGVAAEVVPSGRRSNARWGVAAAGVLVATLAALAVFNGPGRPGQRADVGGPGAATGPASSRPTTIRSPSSAPTSLPRVVNARQVFEDGDQELAANRFLRAEERFTEAIQWARGETLWMSHLGRGQARCMLGDHDGAIEDFQRALNGLSGPGPSDSNKRIVALCYQRRAKAFRDGVRDPVLRGPWAAALTKGLSQLPAHPKLNCLEAEYLLYDAADPDRKRKAGQCLAAALTKGHYAHAAFLQAAWCFKAGQYAEAVHWCDAAAADDGLFAATFRLRADAHDRLGQSPQAAADRGAADALDRAHPARALSGTAIPWLDPWP